MMFGRKRKMNTKILLDTNVFIFAIEFPLCNSALLIENVDFIVSYDRDFKNAKTKIKVLTPKDFAKSLGLTTYDTEY